MKNVMMGTYIKGEENFNFNFGTDLSAHDKTVFVRTVVDTLVNEDGYDFIVKDMIFDFAIVMLFTEIDTSFIKAKDNDGEEISALIPIEQFLEETNVVDIVKANMKIGLLEQLEDAVNKSIEYRTGIHPSPLNDALASLVNTLEKKINEIDSSNMADMAKVFEKMGDDFTPESLVNAYINSDAHMKNMAEIEEAKKQKAKFAKDLDKSIKEVNGKGKKKK